VRAFGTYTMGQLGSMLLPAGQRGQAAKQVVQDREGMGGESGEGGRRYSQFQIGHSRVKRDFRSLSSWSLLR
jgi:hypothetical protein